MPRAIRKSTSRCSSRNSSRSSCRKRQSPRDNVLNTIRDAIRFSPAAKRFNTFKRQSPLLQTPVTTATPRIEEKPQPEVKIEAVKPAVEEPKRAKVSESNVVAAKPRGIIEHGIRYIMLPLHLLQHCVWGSPSAASPEAKEAQPSSPKLQEKETKSSPPASSLSKSESRKDLTPSRASSVSGSSSSSSNKVKRVRRVAFAAPAAKRPISPIAASANSAKIMAASSSATSTPSSATSARPVEKFSSQIRATPVPRRIFPEELTDYSSDEMVTADECYDDSSNDRWSSVASSPAMNMSIDFESHNNVLEKNPLKSSEEDSLEEPMDVSMEESHFNVKSSPCIRSPARNFRLNPLLRSFAERSSEQVSSSSGSEDIGSSYRGYYSSSSADREIAGIFQRASPSPSSSDDEDYSRAMSGERNNNLVSKAAVDLELVRARLCEQLCDETLRKKRVSYADEDAPRKLQTKRNNISRASPAISRSPARPEKSLKLKRSSQELANPKQSFTDVAKVSTQGDSAYSDEDVEMNFVSDSIDHQLPTFGTQSLQESVIEWMDQDLDYVADTEDSNDGSPRPLRSRISSMGSNPSSGFFERDEQLPVRELPVSSQSYASNFEGFTNCLAVQKSLAAPEVCAANLDQIHHQRKITSKAPPGFPERPQYPAGTNCHCGDPKCFFVPMALPPTANLVDESSLAAWAHNYPRAPSPLRHLYYDYPEFMMPPKEKIGANNKSPYVLVPANFVPY